MMMTWNAGEPTFLLYQKETYTIWQWLFGEQAHHHRSVLGKSRIDNTGPVLTGACRPRQSGVKTPDTYYSVPDTYYIIDDTDDIDTIPMTGPYSVPDTYILSLMTPMVLIRH